MPFVTLKEKKLFYEEHGTGFPLLFGHSYLWDAAMWQSQVKHLCSAYQCIVPELWGHGRSEALPQIPYSIEGFAEDHLALINHLKIERCAIIGLSAGGMWAARVALASPHIVKALVLMNTYLGPEPDENQKRYVAMLDMVEKIERIPNPMIEQILSLFFSPETLSRSPFFINNFKERLASMPADRIPSIVASGRAIFSRKSLLDQLSQIEIPTLIIAGEHDRSRSLSESEEMAKKIPNAQFSIIPNAGHVSTLEQPQAVNDVLEKFLKKYL